MERIRQLTSHLSGSSKGLSALEQKRPDDVVITMAVRSPLTKAKKGALKDTGSERRATSLENFLTKTTVQTGVMSF
jgi:acetyl-CoA acyltransferase 1